MKTRERAGRAQGRGGGRTLELLLDGAAVRHAHHGQVLVDVHHVVLVVVERLEHLPRQVHVHHVPQDLLERLSADLPVAGGVLPEALHHKLVLVFGNCAKFKSH